ncbi:Octopamine receptor, partial [Operophtera brumata]
MGTAINPLIYALFSEDFRFAFKRIICKCFCGGGGARRESEDGGGGSRRAQHRAQHSHSLEEDTSCLHAPSAAD